MSISCTAESEVDLNVQISFGEQRGLEVCLAATSGKQTSTSWKPAAEQDAKKVKHERSWSLSPMERIYGSDSRAGMTKVTSACGNEAAIGIYGVLSTSS